MKKYIKNILTDNVLWIFTAITLIFFGTLYKMEFAVDTYATLSFTMKEFINQFASSGRFLLVFVGIIFKILNFNNKTIYILSYLMAIMCMVISLYKLYSIIKEDIGSKFLKILIPILIVLNAFSLELFLFIEKGIMLFGVTMCIFAVGEIKKWLESKNKKYLILSGIFMLLANFSYQGVVGIFVAISIIYILKYSKNIKEFVINNISVALSYGIPAIIDYLLIKICYISSRINGEIILSESLKKIYKSSKDMILNTYLMLPKYLFAILIVAICFIIIYEILSKKENTKGKVIDILKILYIIGAVIFASIAPQIMQNTESIWFVARSTYSYASLFGILVLYLFMNFKNIKNKNKNLVIILSLVLLIVQFGRFNEIETSRYKTNEMDYEITNKIVSKIQEYENQTGNKITNIALYEDKSMSYAYNGVFTTGDTNIKAYAKDWCIIYILKYYAGMDLIETNQDSEIVEKFNNQDWKVFDDNQLIFSGDTLHLCKY